MLRPILGFVALGLTAWFSFKLLGVVLPLLGLVFGVVLFGVKIAIVALIVWALYRLFQKAIRPDPQGG